MHKTGSSRNLDLYPWYAAVFNAHFWMPVFFLYFLERMDFASVLRLEAVYYFGVVLLEVPSGYFSDRFGRRRTLLLACAALLIACGLFFFGRSFGVLAAGQLCLAAGLAFNSGTDTSLHYDSLAALGREEEFDRREAVVARNVTLATGVAAIAGGAVALAGLRFAYLLSAGAAAVALVLVVLMSEPESHEKTQLPPSPLEQAAACGRLLREPVLAWVSAFFVLMTVLNHVPYEFYQPYLGLTLADLGSSSLETPLATGLHVGGAMLVAAWFAGRSIRLRDRLGLRGVLLSAAALQTLVIAVMGLVLHPAVAVLLLLRSVPKALMGAPINAAVAPRVGRGQRATFLSLQSLAGRLAFSGFLMLLSVVPGADGADPWPQMSRQLLLAGAVGLTGVLALACWRRPLRAAESGSRPS